MKRKSNFFNNFDQQLLGKQEGENVSAFTFISVAVILYV